MMVAGTMSARADDPRQLQRVRGDVAIRCATGETPKPILSKAVLPPPCLAMSGAGSAAMLAFDDGSIVGLGAGTDLQAAPYDEGVLMTLFDGTVRFDVHHPPRGVPNFRFVTARFLIVAHGGVGVISIGSDATRIAALSGAAGDVTAAAGGQTYPVPVGQVVTITNAGAVTTAPLTSDVLAAFNSAGVSTDPAIGPIAALAGLR
jgi:ferric-dicitrate binding protein FerR (iron transport regulator)